VTQAEKPGEGSASPEWAERLVAIESELRDLTKSRLPALETRCEAALGDPPVTWRSLGRLIRLIESRVQPADTKKTANTKDFWEITDIVAKTVLAAAGAFLAFVGPSLLKERDIEVAATSELSKAIAALVEPTPQLTSKPDSQPALVGPARQPTSKPDSQQRPEGRVPPALYAHLVAVCGFGKPAARALLALHEDTIRPRGEVDDGRDSTLNLLERAFRCLGRDAEKTISERLHYEISLLDGYRCDRRTGPQLAALMRIANQLNAEDQEQLLVDYIRAAQRFRPEHRFLLRESNSQALRLLSAGPQDPGAGCIATRSRAQLRELDFGYEDLTGIDFGRCDLSDSTFEQTQLPGAKFAGATVNAATDLASATLFKSKEPAQRSQEVRTRDLGRLLAARLNDDDRAAIEGAVGVTTP